MSGRHDEEMSELMSELIERGDLVRAVHEGFPPRAVGVVLEIQPTSDTATEWTEDVALVVFEGAEHDHGEVVPVADLVAVDNRGVRLSRTAAGGCPAAGTAARLLADAPAPARP